MGDPIHGCLATLKVLVQEADTNGLLLAERAIDAHLAFSPNDHQSAEAILILEQDLLPLWERSSGAQLDFINTVLVHLEKRSLEIQERNPPKTPWGPQIRARDRTKARWLGALWRAVRPWMRSTRRPLLQQPERK